MDSRKARILARFEAMADDIADEIAASTLAEVEAFAAVDDGRVRGEIRGLARQHIGAFLLSARTGQPPAPEVLAAARERAVLRARELMPIAALLHSYLIAQRVISAAIVRSADTDARSLGAALELIAVGFDYNIATTAAMATAYVEVVQGDLAEVDSARRSLIDVLLTGEPHAPQAVARRALGLGFDPDRELAVAVAVVDPPGDRGQATGPPRRTAQAIARWTGRPERQAFVVTRERDLVAILDAAGIHRASTVLERAGQTIASSRDGCLRAGIGTPFRGLGGFSVSYREAQRALRYADSSRPIVTWPDDVLLFDELTTSPSDDAERLIPEATRLVLADHSMRATVQAYFAANLNVGLTARALSLHPNSVRYRLQRIADITGRDPRRLADLVELIAAVRLLGRESVGRPRAGAGH